MDLVFDILVVAIAFVAGGMTWRRYGPRITAALHGEVRPRGGQSKDTP